MIDPKSESSLNAADSRFRIDPFTAARSAASELVLCRLCFLWPWCAFCGLRVNYSLTPNRRFSRFAIITPVKTLPAAPPNIPATNPKSMKMPPPKSSANVLPRTKRAAIEVRVANATPRVDPRIRYDATKGNRLDASVHDDAQHPHRHDVEHRHRLRILSTSSRSSGERDSLLRATERSNLCLICGSSCHLQIRSTADLCPSRRCTARARKHDAGDR